MLRRGRVCGAAEKMLQWWADYLDSIVNESKVIVGNFGFAG